MFLVQGPAMYVMEIHKIPFAEIDTSPAFPVGKTGACVIVDVSISDTRFNDIRVLRHLYTHVYFYDLRCFGLGA